MDFSINPGKSRLYTLHSHTQFCDGRADMEHFVVAAIEAGFSHYGFTPHSPVPFPSPCNMTEDSIPLYNAEFQRLKEKYGHRIALYKSMEIDFIDDIEYNAASERVKGYGLDYTISSVHFIPTQEGDIVDIDGRPESFIEKMHANFHDDIDYVVEKFFSQSLKMLEIGGFDIIGHFDKISLNASYYAPGIEDTPGYIRHLNDLIDSIIASGVTVEINTKALATFNRFFPHPKHWQRLIEAKMPILVNSDVHYPHLVNAGRQEAYKILDSITSI